MNVIYIVKRPTVRTAHALTNFVLPGDTVVSTIFPGSAESVDAKDFIGSPDRRAMDHELDCTSEQLIRAMLTAGTKQTYAIKLLDADYPDHTITATRYTLNEQQAEAIAFRDAGGITE